MPTAKERRITVADELLTVDELCTWLKVKKSWVYDACRDRGLPVFRLGGKGGSMRFDRAEVLTWLRDQQ